MPTTVSDLIARLSTLPGDVPVHSVVVVRSGWYHDREHANVDNIDVRLGDDGQILDVWLVAHTTGVEPPAVMTIRCACGELVMIDDTNPWPHDHLACVHRQHGLD